MRGSAARSKRDRDPPKKRAAVETANPSSGAAPRLYEQIYTILARQIRDGKRPQGERLGESDIALQFGVSRAPVRQALGKLEQSGLIEKAGGRGYRVSSVKSKRKRSTAQLAGAAQHDAPLVSPVTWERIYAEVESELAARISFGSWRVNEAELARHYRVSRTVTRDVVGRLQQKGVLRKDGRSRWYAPALTPDYIGELYEMRSLLEPVALTKAAPCVPDGFIAGMRANLEAALADPEAIKGGMLDRLETEMHETLIGFCGNQTLMLAIELPQSLLIAHRFLYKWTPRLFDTEPFLPEHLEIVRSLEQGRTGKAAELLREHLLVSKERMIERIRSLAGKFSPDDLPYLTLLSSV